jgi:glycogen debranching enzyme
MVFIQDPNTQALPRLYSLTLDDDGSPTKDKSVNSIKVK